LSISPTRILREAEKIGPATISLFECAHRLIATSIPIDLTAVRLTREIKERGYSGA
jgi:hypothetical protein